MPLILLKCSQNPITTLDPLKGVPLNEIALEHTSVASLEPLRGMALSMLSAKSTHVSDLTPLKGMNLTMVYISFTEVSDLGPLTEMSTQYLDARFTKVSNLVPLKGTLIEHLDISNSAVSEISSLDSTSLAFLSMGYTRVSDLLPLSTRPLEFLSFRHCSITAIEPLISCPLQYLDMSGNGVHSLASLQKHPLKYLDCRNNPLADLALIAENPPPVFLFSPQNLPPEQVKEIFAKYEKKGFYKIYSSQDAICLADTGICRSLFGEFRKNADMSNRFYLDIPMTWGEAKELCEKAGGHMVSVMHEADNDQAAENGYFPSEKQHVAWLGLTADAAGLHWAGGEPVEYTNFAPGEKLRPGRHAIISAQDRLWRVVDDSAKADIMIEWKN
jgi:hypothetical protein